MKSRKIIFTDFFGTLATSEIVKRNNLEIAQQEYEDIASFFNKFLNKNNYIYVISTLTHLSPNKFIELYNNLVSTLDKEKADNLFFYIRYPDGDPTVFTDEVPKNFLFEPGHKYRILNNIMSEMNIGSNDIVIGAGNDEDDMNMLFIINDIGGTSYYVNQYNSIAHNMGIDELIRNISSKKAIKYSGDFDKMSEEWITIYNNLSELYKSANISREKLEEMYSFLAISQDYDNCYFSGEKIYSIDENTVEKKLVLVNNRRDIFNKFGI